MIKPRFLYKKLHTASYKKNKMRNRLYYPGLSVTNSIYVKYHVMQGCFIFSLCYDNTGNNDRENRTRTIHNNSTDDVNTYDSCLPVKYIKRIVYYVCRKSAIGTTVQIE